MMELSDKLKEKGWYLSEEGVDTLVQYANSKDINVLTKKALEIDLKKIGSGALTTDISKSNNDFINGNFVVQITKIKNMAAPKINQESTRSPRLLKFTLTDGKFTLIALEMKMIKGLSLNTPPGTKLFLKDCKIKVMHNFVLLNPDEVVVLGGKVASLFEKWELEQNLSKYSKGRNASGISEMGRPPVWIPFGQSTSDNEVISEESKKNNPTNVDINPNNATAEFDALRQENIERALSEAKNIPKKTFGGGKKKLVDVNVQKIMDKGFSQTDAENALKFSKQNVEKALKRLQFNNQDQNTNNKFKKFEKHKTDLNKKDIEDCRKPSTAKISLSDFLEEKLPTKLNKEEPKDILYDSKQENASNQFNNKRVNNNPNFKAKLESYKFEINKKNGETNSYPKYEQKQQFVKPTSNTKFGNRSNNFSSKPFSNNRNESFNKQSNFDESKNKKYYQDNQLENRFYDKNNPGYKDNEGKRYYNKTKRQDSVANELSDIVQKTANLNLNSNQRSMAVKLSGPTVSNDIKPFRNNQTNYIPNSFASSDNRVSGSDNRIAANSDNRIANSDNRLTGSDNRFNNHRNIDSNGWKWSIGDRCLAKYWEDKKYYDAEITGLSRNTCVVRFLEYGNFEEINKFDCLPYEDSVYTQGRPNNQNRVYKQTNKNETASSSDIQKKSRPIRNVQKLYVPPAQRN